MLPQLDPTWYASQTLWMLITFCTMFVIMWRFVMPLMRATVDARQSRLEKDIRKTEEFKTEAAGLQKKHEEQEASVKDQTRALLAQAQDEAQALTKKMEEEFSSRLNAHIAEKEKSVAAAKNEAMQSVQDISADLVKEIAQKLAGVSLNSEEIKEITSSVMEKSA